MQGRYGVDEVFYFLFLVYLVLAFINLFFKSNLLTTFELIIFIFNIYRVLSKNLEKRRKERDKYLELEKKIQKKWKKIRIRKLEAKNHLFRKCPHCKTKLRLPLPSKRGFHHVKCPSCGHRLTIFSLRCEKVEIIRKKERRK